MKVKVRGEVYESVKEAVQVLGFERDNSTQNWLRLHQILLSHENRLTDLENKEC